MSANNHTDNDQTDNNPSRDDRPKIELSGARIVAGALAAVTAAILASQLGVAGTVVGTAVISVVSGFASTIYQRSIERTKGAVVTARDKGADALRERGIDGGLLPRLGRAAPNSATDATGAETAPGSVPAPDEEPDESGAARESFWRRLVESPRRRWAVAAAGTGATFVLALAIVTGIELGRGAPLSTSGSGSGGTTLSELVDAGSTGAAAPSGHHPGNSPSSAPSTPAPSGPSAPSQSPSTSPTPGGHASGAPSGSPAPTTPAPAPSATASTQSGTPSSSPPPSPAPTTAPPQTTAPTPHPGAVPNASGSPR